MRLNQPRSVRSSLEVCRYGMSLFVCHEAHFRPVEVDGSAFEACLAEGFCELVEFQQWFHELLVAFLGCRGVFENILHLLVCISAVRTYYRVAYAAVIDVSLIVDFHNHGVCEFLLVGTQRA